MFGRKSVNYATRKVNPNKIGFMKERVSYCQAILNNLNWPAAIVTLQAVSVFTL